MLCYNVGDQNGCELGLGDVGDHASNRNFTELHESRITNRDSRNLWFVGFAPAYLATTQLCIVSSCIAPSCHRVIAHHTIVSIIPSYFMIKTQENQHNTANQHKPKHRSLLKAGMGIHGYAGYAKRT